MRQKNTFLYELLNLYLAQFKVSSLISISQGDLWFKFLGFARLAFSYYQVRGDALFKTYS